LGYLARCLSEVPCAAAAVVVVVVVVRYTKQAGWLAFATVFATVSEKYFGNLVNQKALEMYFHELH